MTVWRLRYAQGCTGTIANLLVPALNLRVRFYGCPATDPPPSKRDCVVGLEPGLTAIATTDKPAPRVVRSHWTPFDIEH